MEINDEILETISRERCARARDILRRSGIVEAWREAGAQVEIVGSLRMGLMMKHRDIDLHIYSAPLTLDRSFAAMARIAACPNIGRIECRNLMATEERCVEWHAEWAEPDDGTWMIDMIHIERGSRYDGYFERMADGVRRAADDEMRRAILRLKWLSPMMCISWAWSIIVRLSRAAYAHTESSSVGVPSIPPRASSSGSLDPRDVERKRAVPMREPLLSFMACRSVTTDPT